MEFIENLVNNSMFYYIVVAVTYVLIIAFVVMLLMKNKSKKRAKQKLQEAHKKDIESVDLEAVLGKMQEDIEKPKEEVRTFEEEQEAKAIISYQELLQAVKKDVTEVTSVNLDEVEVFSDPMEEADLPTVKAMSKINDNSLKPEVLASEENIQVEIPKVMEEPKEEPKKVERPIDLVRPKNDTKFQNSEFISPIYGRVNNEAEYPTIPSQAKPEVKVEEKLENLEKTIVFKPINDNIDNDEFLKALKEFRNNLE